ncbi:hypothetical protein BO71DRAFT_401643 [Aspergillus ellipticus CBS 707.79]|uniref:Uncharacterized protein n=1 Tax=Aspergillus ellipticus CBS 707.79 TaxID=1448320 RepID=A0A319D9I5_9EURO|nr:hypothetical protein BO71DRAFT_401643 [Aspergillus ellipticus CBS 707.79]
MALASGFSTGASSWPNPYKYGVQHSTIVYIPLSDSTLTPFPSEQPYRASPMGLRKKPLWVARHASLARANRRPDDACLPRQEQPDGPFGKRRRATHGSAANGRCPRWFLASDCIAIGRFGCSPGLIKAPPNQRRRCVLTRNHSVPSLGSPPWPRGGAQGSQARIHGCVVFWSLLHCVFHP